MSCQEQQQEELEVLRSIYEGDPNFKEISESRFQYKYGEDGNHKSFIVEISWGDKYPDDSPHIDLDLFYNKHILPSVKEVIEEGVRSQVSDLIGFGMTYTLFEWLRENETSVTTDQPDTPPISQILQTNDTEDVTEEVSEKKKEKKEVLTKAQKRRHYDRLGEGGERPRGWDWVDIVKHLSQTGHSANS